MTTFPAKQISISIDRPVDEVYQYASNPFNLPKWAAGLSGATLHQEGDDFITQSPMGRVRISFAKKNSYGVLDHDVILPSGEIFHNPLRIIKNGGGSEVVFTLYRQPQMSDEDFNRDASAVESDLQKLRDILQK